MTPPETMAIIARRIAAAHKIMVADLTGPSRLRKHAWPRQEAYAACRTLPRSFQQIADFFGGRDNTSVQRGVRAYARRLAAGARP